MKIEVAFPTPMQVGECPLWVPQEAALYWVDIDGFAVHRLHPASGVHRSWTMPSEPAAIARCASGGLIVALREGFAHLDTSSCQARPALRPIAAAPYDTALMRFNDGRVDASGRFWVGTMYEPRDRQLGQMFCLERGVVRTIWSGDMTVSNGLGFSPDQKTLYHADTTAHVIRRHDFDIGAAGVANAQVFKQFCSDKSANNYGGRPDGAAVDSEDAYWCAMFEGGRLLRLAPDGALLQEIALPLRCPTMLAFGGDDLRTIYVTSASHNRQTQELAQYPLSGCVLSLRVDVPGRVETAYID
jgi:sugar lactone lactonase YvrE